MLMDVTLIYFSQSGNTRKVAAAMAEAFRDEGQRATMISLQKATADDVVRCDLLGVGTGCRSSQAPTPIKRFLCALPPLAGKHAFVFATSSAAPGRVLYDLTRRLRKRGAGVLGGFLARGQVHHPAPHMTGQFRGRPSAQDLTEARRFARGLAAHIAAGRSVPVPANRPDALRPGWGLYDLLGRVVSDAVLRVWMPEPKLDVDKCDRCGWCARACPMDNIRLLPRPVLGEQCMRCYRCLTGCPQQAFDADWRFADRLLLVLYNTTFMRWFGDLRAGEVVY